MLPLSFVLNNPVTQQTTLIEKSMDRDSSLSQSLYKPEHTPPKKKCLIQRPATSDPRKKQKFDKDPLKAKPV